MAKKPLEIDMIAGSQLRDTQGEMLSVEGADISDLQAGKGRLNDNHGKGFFNSIGTVTDAKKIFKKEDCENDRHSYYWDKVKAPFIYVRGYLFDDEDHPNARAAAAILRNIHKNDSPLQLKASVEGGVLARGISDNTLLAKTKIHSVALTFTPANKNTLVEPVSLDKTSFNEEEDTRIIKSVLHLAKTNVPSFRHIVRDAAAQKIEDNLNKISDLSKKLGLPQNFSNISKQSILENAIEDKIKHNVALIHSIITGSEDLDKGLKETGLAAALSAGLMASTPQQAEAKRYNPPVAKRPISAVVNKKPKLGSMVIRNNDHAPHIAMYEKVKQTNPFLGITGFIESSGGLQHDGHITLTAKDMNYGHTAGGIWAMLPNHAAFTISKDKQLAAKYPQLAKLAKTVKNKNFKHHIFTNTFNKDPQAAADFAISAYNYLRTKFKSYDAMAAAWNIGISGTMKLLKNGKNALANLGYVQKFRKGYREYLNQRRLASDRADNMSKALMAGYGGGSAPTSRVGGAVLQSEWSPKSLKYITCDRCGKEQVHAKYQVKCRHCNDNFSLKKLNEILS